MFNTYCFSTATMVTLTRLNMTLMRTLPVLLYFRINPETKQDKASRDCSTTVDCKCSVLVAHS